jgi:hypothetical protein
LCRIRHPLYASCCIGRCLTLPPLYCNSISLRIRLAVYCTAPKEVFPTAQALREPAKEDATNVIADLLSIASKDQGRILAGYLRTPVLKYQGHVRLISGPNWHFCHGIFGILILIIQHLFQSSPMHIYYFCSMHALPSPPRTNHFTHRTQPSRYNCVSAYMQGTDAQLTPRNTSAAPRA